MTILMDPLGYFYISVTLAVGVLHQTSLSLFSSFSVLGDAIMADVENHALEP